MKLYLMRHGYAGPGSPDPKRERERPLLPEGQRMARAIAKAMADAGELPNYIFASPFARAIQTADIVAKTWNDLGLAGDNPYQVNVIDDLAPQRPLEPQVLDIIGFQDIKRVMLVGHKDNTTPMMQSFGGDAKWKDLVMAEVRRVRMDRKTGAWKLRWCLRPSDLGLKDYDS
jgi:phosphohistidine phosphatase SixA